MKVREFIKMLQGRNPEATLVVPGFDHSYRKAHVYECDAIFDPINNYISEDHGPDYMNPQDTVIKVVVFQ